MDRLSKIARGLRLDVLEMAYRSGAGHIGGDLSVMEILTALYFEIMNVSPENFRDPNRDRFLLSKGHCADALYCALGARGFFDLREAIETFGAPGSKFIGHPNAEVPGVEFPTGALGHGLSVGVGMALAGKMDVKSHRVYVVAGDGEMAEGSNYEALMAAAHYRLDNLCLTVDLNGLQISGATRDVMNTADLEDKFRAFGWNAIRAADGNDLAQLVAAYRLAAAHPGAPTAVLARTVKGKGVSFMENQAQWHHGVLTGEQYARAVAELKAGAPSGAESSVDNFRIVQPNPRGARLTDEAPRDPNDAPRAAREREARA